MALDFTDIVGARNVFRQLYNQVQSIFNWDIKGNRLQNVGNAQADSDAVTLKQLNDAIAKISPAQSSSSGTATAQIIDSLKISASLTPVLDNKVDIGASGNRFKKLWVYLIDVATTITFSGLTASRPLKLDSSKLVISAKIDLSAPTTDIQNKLTLANGGTNADLSATGGTSQLLKQLSSGAAITVGSIATTDLSDVTSGTFTPVLSFGFGTTGITYSVQSGEYYKIGKLVVATLRIVLTSKGSSTGTLRINGLPFNPANTIGGLIAYLINAASLTVPMVSVTGGTDEIDIFQYNTTTIVSMTDANFTNTTEIRIALVYHT